MADPDEGVAPDGTIRTGARRDRVPDLFEPVLAEAMALIDHETSLYVYGSVANGTARPGSSDVDLLAVGLRDASIISRRLSEAYADRCRAVEVADTTAADFDGESDAAYGNRVFLRHYCVHLTGPDPAAALPPFPADACAARGFNGDLDRHLARWRQDLAARTTPPAALAVGAARKTLLALAGMVSVHDRTWTTDRVRAARRWSEVEPALATPLALLQAWSDGTSTPTRGDLDEALGPRGVVATVVARFADTVGLWDQRS